MRSRDRDARHGGGSARSLLWSAGMANDHYDLGELLGRGGMGQVHVARSRSGREVAVKRVRNTLSGDRLLAVRLCDEARLLQTVSHPNVVRMLDHGTGPDGLPFLVMARAFGTPLHQLIARSGTLPIDRAVVITAQLFAGLAAIHDARIVHADLKSHNVLVDDVDIVTIIDFGLARAVTASAASDGLIAGTPAYMAPEMIAGATPTVAADIYAVGTIIYEMLTGSTPYSGHISTILTHQLSSTIEPPSLRAPGLGITAALDRVLLRALDPAPAARFQSVSEFAAAFALALGHVDVQPLLAVGSEFWTEQPTVQRPAPGPLRAAGTMPVRTERLIDRTESIISSALDGAQHHIANHRAVQAIQELEATRASLLPTLDGDVEGEGFPAVWRVETVLAALYDSLGKHERARRMALVAYRHALKTGCPRAEQRARALVDRLVARGRRLARGSVGDPR
jgi:serine/threonine protein kinase